MKDYKQDSDFIWADLSALDLGKAKKFYKDVFDWSLVKDTSKDGIVADADDQFGVNNSTYYAALTGATPVAGIFDMPEFFVKINMPSFWMSYLSVEDIQGVVDRARKIKNVIIEVEPTPFAKGKMALIRDPAGAGFTVYEGEPLGKKGSGAVAGQVVWNELIIDSAKKVKPFYEKVFGFSLQKDADYDGTRYKVINQNGKEIAGIQEVDESLRGPKVYWVPFFAVNSIGSFEQKVTNAGGTLLFRDNNPYGAVALIEDSQGGSFGVAETGAITNPLSSSSLKTMLTFAALAFVWVAALYEWQWVWGIAFLLWVIPDIRSGNTYLLGPVNRSESPITYWAIIATWLFMAIGLILATN